MADVSAKLLGQFVDCLETKVLAEQSDQAVGVPEGSVIGSDPAPTDAPVVAAAPAVTPVASAARSSSGPRRIESAEAEPINLLDTAGSSVAKRAAPVLGVIAVFWLLRVLLRRRKK